LFYFTNCYQNLLIFHRRVVKVRIKKVWRHTWKDLAAYRLRNTALNWQIIVMFFIAILCAKMSSVYKPLICNSYFSEPCFRCTVTVKIFCPFTLDSLPRFILWFRTLRQIWGNIWSKNLDGKSEKRTRWKSSPSWRCADSSESWSNFTCFLKQSVCFAWSNYSLTFLTITLTWPVLSWKSVDGFSTTLQNHTEEPKSILNKWCEKKWPFLWIQGTLLLRCIYYFAH